MIYYERAEAYEFLRLYDKAIFDYENARKFLDVEHWKYLSVDGITRVECKKNKTWENENQKNGQWEVFHRLHCLDNIDALTKYDTYIAMALFDSEPRMTALLLRCCLETILLSILPINFSYNNSNERRIEQMIDTVKTLGQEMKNPMDVSIYEDMDLARKIGIDAAHPNKRID